VQYDDSRWGGEKEAQLRMIRQALHGLIGDVDFPANRERLVRQAREQEAPERVVQALAGLPDRMYQDWDAVAENAQWQQ